MWQHTFEAFLCANIFNKTVFVQEKKEGMLVNVECSSWHKEYIGNFGVSLGIEKRTFVYSNGPIYTPRQSNPTPECVVMALSTIVVECEQFIYLLIISTRALTVTKCFVIFNESKSFSYRVCQ